MSADPITGSVGQSSAVYSVGTSEASSSTAAASVAGTSLLPQPVMILGGNAMTQLAALMTQCDEQNQVNNTTMENAANKAAEQESDARVAALRDKASQDFTGALVSGLSDVAAGGLSIGGAVVTGGPATSGTASADVGRGWSGILNGGSKMFGSSGLGSILAAGYKAGADNDDANAAQAESASDAEVRSYNAASSQVQAAADALSKIEDTISGILQAQAQTGLKVATG